MRMIAMVEKDLQGQMAVRTMVLLTLPPIPQIVQMMTMRPLAAVHLTSRKVLGDFGKQERELVEHKFYEAVPNLIIFPPRQPIWWRNLRSYPPEPKIREE